MDYFTNLIVSLYGTQIAILMIRRKNGFSGERALILPQSVLHELEEDPMTSILYITDIGYYPKAQHHFRERSEPITQFILIYCTEGTGWFRTEGRECKIAANQYFILPAEKPHAYGADEKDPWTIYWIHFKGTLAAHFATHCVQPITIDPGMNSRISNRIAMFEEILRTLEMGYSRENLRYASSIFYHYLGSLCYLQQYRNAAHSETTGKYDIVTAAIHFMKENVEKKLSLHEIASYTGYSASHFSILFNRRTGYAPLAYFNQLKIQQACQLLDFTDMKINQVCYKIGIEDTYYFSRLFSKIMGMSPRAYKQLKKG